LNSYEKILSLENDIYKQLYEESKQHRHQINSKLTPTITIITAEITAILWLIFKVVDNIKKYNMIIRLHHLCPIILTVMMICSWVFSIVFLILCLTNYKVRYIDPIRISEGIEDNKTYLQYYTEEDILDNIKADIVNGYKQASIENWIETNKHSSYLNKCYIFLIITLAFIIIDFLFILFI
jgi:hypothetical protein